MKLLKIFCVAVVAMLSVSCESEMWSTEQPSYVDVYRLYDIRDDKSVLELDHIDIYKNKPIMIETSDKGILSIYDMVDYKDASNSSEFNITFSVEERDLKTDEVTLDKDYKISGALDRGYVDIEITDNLVESDNVFTTDALIKSAQMLN